MAVLSYKNKGKVDTACAWRYVMAALFFLLTALAVISPAFAGPVMTDVDVVSTNVVTSISALPGAIAGISYLLALLFAVTGILKLKEHVNNPQQVALRVPIIRFLVGGGLLALPIVYEAMATTINGGANAAFDPESTYGNALSAVLGIIGTVPVLNNLNNVFGTIIDSIEETPALIAAVAYVLALVAGVGGLLKLREHVENPEQVPLREPVIRLFIGGALFAIPTVYDAMFNTIGGPTIMGQITSIAGAIGMIFSSINGVLSPLNSTCNPIAAAVNPILGGNVSLGQAMCGIFFNAGAFPAFLMAIGYLIGLFLGVWGILKIKAHVLNPQQTSLWDGISRLGAGGAFFALPAVIEVIKNTLIPGTATLVSTFQQTTGFNEPGGLLGPVCNGTGGLDVALYCLMNDTMAPMHVVLNFFTTVAGIILAMIGISRLMKSAQDGARAPGGLGTIMTFIASGALLSYNALMRVVTVSLSAGIPGVALSRTNGVMQYTQGMSQAEQDHAHTVISAILKFMIIVGLISFIRGIFIIRSVAEGNAQASIMAGITHMVGGALAVNLGSIINFVQNTLGITTYGITFT
jgi:hypothetical protein